MVEGQQRAYQAALSGDTPGRRGISPFEFFRLLVPELEQMFRLEAFRAKKKIEQ
jgi:hypothetical protein